MFQMVIGSQSSDIIFSSASNPFENGDFRRTIFFEENVSIIKLNLRDSGVKELLDFLNAIRVTWWKFHPCT